MTLILTLLATAITLIILYGSEKARNMNINILCYMFGGASLMWTIDFIVELVKEGPEVVFHPQGEEILNEFLLALAVIALALLIWIIIVLIKDPKKIFKK